MILWFLLVLTLAMTSADASAQIIRGGGGGGSVSTWSDLLSSGSMSTSESVPFDIRGIGGQATNGRRMYQSSGGLWVDVCVVADVENACNYIRNLSASFRLEVTNHLGTPIFTLTNDTGALTNITLDCTLASNVCTVTEEQWFDVAACQAGVAQLIYDSPSSNAPVATCDPDSSPEAYASFDASTDESFSLSWVLPTGFVPSAGIDVHFIWKAAATSGATGWCAQMVRVPDGTTSGQSVAAQSSSNCVSDTAKGTTLQENHATITAATCTSCVARDRIKVTISRDANGGAVTDGMSGDAHLLKVGRTWRVAK